MPSVRARSSAGVSTFSSTRARSKYPCRCRRGAWRSLPRGAARAAVELWCACRRRHARASAPPVTAAVARCRRVLGWYPSAVPPPCWCYVSTQCGRAAAQVVLLELARRHDPRRAIGAQQAECPVRPAPAPRQGRRRCAAVNRAPRRRCASAARRRQCACELPRTPPAQSHLRTPAVRTPGCPSFAGVSTLRVPLPQASTLPVPPGRVAISPARCRARSRCTLVRVPPQARAREYPARQRSSGPVPWGTGVVPLGSTAALLVLREYPVQTGGPAGRSSRTRSTARSPPRCRRSRS